MKPRTESSTVTEHQRVRSVDVEVLSALFDSAQDVAFFVKDADGRYVTVNNSLVKRHGLQSKTDAIGKLPSDICKGDFGQLPSKQDAALLRTGRPLIDHLEMQWNRPNDPVWCLTTKLPLLDDRQKVIGLVGFSRDVRVSVQREEIPNAFAKALKEFESTLSAKVTPAWLARHSEMTPQQLSRLTKRLFELTPTQLIAKIRVAAASQLLRDSDDSVAKVANTCGFYDHSAFTRAFRNATGVTPSQFRKQ